MFHFKSNTPIVANITTRIVLAVRIYALLHKSVVQHIVVTFTPAKLATTDEPQTPETEYDRIAAF